MSGNDFLGPLLRSARNPVLLYDRDRRVADANDQALNLLGYSWEEITKLRADDLVPPEVLPGYEETWKEFLRLGATHGDFEMIARDGQRVPVFFQASANVQEGLHLVIFFLQESAYLGLLAHLKEGAEPECPELTAREQQILWLLSDGAINGQVAHGFDLAQGTVQQHIKNLRYKLGAATRAQIIERSLALGVMKCHASREDTCIYQVVFASDQAIDDLVLRYVSYKTLNHHPRIGRMIDQPVSSWYSEASDPEFHEKIRAALDDEQPQLFKDLTYQLPWETQPTRVSGQIEAVGDDRVMIRTVRSEAIVPV